MNKKISRKHSKQTTISNIMEWLYLNDGAYKNKYEWRKALTEMLKAQIKSTAIK